MTNSPSNEHEPHESWWFSRSFFAVIGVILILGYLIYEGHSAHLLGALPFLFFLSCPLMHFFMHGGHHHHHAGNPDAPKTGEANEHSKSGGCH